MKKNDHFFDNKWVVRLVSLLFAIFLYAFVSTENYQYTQAHRVDNTSVNVTETIYNVPVSVGQVDDDVFVSGLPESVNVRITGPRNVIQQFISEEIRVTTEDLSDFSTGYHLVRLVLAGANSTSGINYSITPSQVRVEIGHLETKEVDVEYEIDPNLVAPGYVVSNVSLNPATITLRGKAETIKKVDRVYIRINGQEQLTESFAGTYSIQVRDVNNNILDVNTSHAEINASVEIRPAGNTVPIEVNAVGEDPSRFAYSYSLTGPAEVSINGDAGALRNVQAVIAHVDVTNLTESATLIGFLQEPAGVHQMSLQEVPVYVEVIPIESASSNVSPEEGSSSATSDDSTGTESESTEESELVEESSASSEE